MIRPFCAVTAPQERPPQGGRPGQEGTHYAQRPWEPSPLGAIDEKKINFVIRA